MPRQPRGKRTTTADGDIEAVSKNSNGDGSVCFEPERTSKDGKVRPGYWRASDRAADGKRRTVSGPTRVQAEARREVKLAEIAAMPCVGSRFSRDTTVAELTDWWLDSVARHQVKASTLDSYRKFASYLADDIGTHTSLRVGVSDGSPVNRLPTSEQWGVAHKWHATEVSDEVVAEERFVRSKRHCPSSSAHQFSNETGEQQ